MTTKRAGHQKARVVTRFVKKPEPLEPGKVRCLGCSKPVTLTKNGHLRRHRDVDGTPCPYSATYAQPVALSELPPVVVPPQRQRTTRKADERRRDNPERLRANNECVDCGKWLPGERKVCGACYVRRDTERAKRRRA